MNKKNFFRFSKKDIFPISLILLMVFSRLIPHPPNFTPIIAVAIMSGYFFKNLYLSIIVLLISMLLSDLFFGFYKHIIFVYLSLFLITYIFFQINHKINNKNLFIFGLVGSLIFFLVSNFGVWIMGDLYEKNLNGLLNCYVFAIPFFRNTLISTIIYIYVCFFSSYFLKFLLIPNFLKRYF